jgi:hypothetical protein
LDNVKDTARKTQFRYSFSLFDRKKGRPTQSEHVIGGFAVHVLQSIRVPGGKKKVTTRRSISRIKLLCCTKVPYKNSRKARKAGGEMCGSSTDRGSVGPILKSDAK